MGVTKQTLTVRGNANFHGSSALQSLLEQVDLLRIDANRKLKPEARAEWGQYMTPATVAKLMASMACAKEERINILDAGAGVGSLAAALIGEICGRPHKPEAIHLCAYEVDEFLFSYMKTTAELCKKACQEAKINFTSDLRCDDFIRSACDAVTSQLFVRNPEEFSCVILNPPYRKINSASAARRLLRSAGIETSNLYSGFIYLAMKLVANDGEISAITPRSFCNGPYFKPFRKHLL